MTDFPLKNGIYELPNDRLATLVTYLEMTERPPAKSVALPAGVSFTRHNAPSVEWYRALYKNVGEDWLWFSRQEMDDASLSAVIHNPAVEIYALEKNGVAEGLLELDFRDPDTVELAFFGLSNALIGTGSGRYLMEQAIELTFSRGTKRFFVHTCELDSPQALAFYLRSGFTPYKRAVEIMTDPRYEGLPKTAAPQVPLL